MALPERLQTAFVLFHVTLALVVAQLSVSTLIHAHSGPRANPHLVLLAGAEALAALLFLVPATLRVGGSALLLIFAFAFIFHGLHGEWATQLLIFGAGVWLVMAHEGLRTSSGAGTSSR